MSSLQGSPSNGAGLHVGLEPSSEPKPKRRKIGVACELCRVRKSRCDGQRPKCGPCSKRKAAGDACVYADGEMRYEHPAPVPADTNGHLKAQAPSVRAAIPPTPSATTVASELLRSNASDQRQRTHSPDHTGENDAMGNLADWALKSGRPGASSSASFMQSIRKAIDGTVTPDPDRTTQRVAFSHAATIDLYPRRKQSLAGHSAEYVLPPRKTADRLLDIHWRRSHIIFPWLDRLRIMNWYEGLWTGQEQVDPFVDEQVYHCILNLIFAISYKLDPSVSPEEAENLSHPHFLRAQRLLFFNLMDMSHISLVQALLLMCQYLQSTNMPRQCSRSLGMAIWIAEDMGLHLPETTAAIQSQYDLEMARRAWHGCVLMDRVTSMLFGRPCRISQDLAVRSPMPTTIDDEFVGVRAIDGRQPAGKTSRLCFFVAYCKLHIILADILSTFYDVRSQSGQSTPEETIRTGTGGKQNVDKLLHFDNALNDWRANLDARLQIESAEIGNETDEDSDTIVFARQSMTLYSRFLYIRMLLYRPFYSKLSEKTDLRMVGGDAFQGPNLMESITHHGLVACVKAAQQLLDLIAGKIKCENRPDVLQPWWHVISYVYTAGTVIISANLFPSVIERVTASELELSMRKCFNIVEHYEDRRMSVQRYKSALAGLYDKIMSRRSRRQSPSGALNAADTVGSDLNIDFDFPGGFIYDAKSLSLFEENELLWLTSAPFHSEGSSWL